MQGEFDFGGPEKDTSSQDKARARKVENEEFKDKRTKSSPLIVNAELNKMKEILDKPKGSGGGGSMGTGKMSRDITKNMKAGGMASKRADGCAIRGKTKGRML